ARSGYRRGFSAAWLLLRDGTSETRRRATWSQRGVRPRRPPRCGAAAQHDGSPGMARVDEPLVRPVRSDTELVRLVRFAAHALVGGVNSRTRSHVSAATVRCRKARLWPTPSLMKFRPRSRIRSSSGCSMKWDGARRALPGALTRHLGNIQGSGVSMRRRLTNGYAARLRVRRSLTSWLDCWLRPSNDRSPSTRCGLRPLRRVRQGSCWAGTLTYLGITRAYSTCWESGSSA